MPNAPYEDFDDMFIDDGDEGPFGNPAEGRFSEDGDKGLKDLNSDLDLRKTKFGQELEKRKKERERKEKAWLTPSKEQKEQWEKEIQNTHVKRKKIYPKKRPRNEEDASESTENPRKKW